MSFLFLFLFYLQGMTKNVRFTFNDRFLPVHHSIETAGGLLEDINLNPMSF